MWMHVQGTLTCVDHHLSSLLRFSQPLRPRPQIDSLVWVTDSDWARLMAGDLLTSTLPKRWHHVQGVAARAESLGTHARTPLIASAWLHDIGYAPALLETGFHPIDGARHLRREGVDEAIVNLVAHHSCAHVEAGLRHLELETEFLR